jgi:hypothetical protein
MIPLRPVQQAGIRVPMPALSRICSLASAQPSAKLLQPDFCVIKPWRSSDKCRMCVARYLFNCRYISMKIHLKNLFCGDYYILEND